MGPNHVRFLSAFLLLASLASAAPQEFVSGATRAHLIELFTSEGCSSCPPAEAWLTDLSRDPRVWRDLIPVAWHVDYWDRLGWRDRFASKEATKREYAYAARWAAETVYTPCTVIDGAEATARRVPAPSLERVGILRAKCDGARVHVQFDSAHPGEYDAHAVRLSLGVMSKVRAGENAGRTLRHDFIASGPMSTAALSHDTADLDLPSAATDGDAQQAIAVWITRRGELVPIQAVGGILAAAH